MVAADYAQSIERVSINLLSSGTRTIARPMNYRKILARNAKALKERDETLNSNAKIAARCTTPTRKVAATAIGYMMDANSDINPKLDTIVAFAEVFKVRPGDLLDPNFDVATRKVRPAEDLSPEIVALATRIAAVPQALREQMSDIFAEPVPDQELEAAGFASPRSTKHAIHERPAPYHKEPRQLKMKLKR